MNSNKSLSYITSVIITYWVVSISMVYLNKMLLSNEDASISAPLFVTWLLFIYLSLILTLINYSNY